MSINLTVPFALGNGARLLVLKAEPHDEIAEMTVSLQMRTSVAGGDIVISDVALVIRNGVSDRVSRGVLSAGQNYAGALLYEPRALTTATGFTDAMNAWRGGNSNSNRKVALETQMLAAGTIHSSLTGT